MFLITLMLGCSIVGLLLQPQKKNPDLMLIGSGSVHGYLKEVFPSLLKENATPKVLVLEGSSDAGQRLLTDAYQDKDNDRLPEVPFLAMASKQLEIKEFQVQRPEKDRFFEIQIGIDPLKVTLGGGSDSGGKQRKVREVFSNLFGGSAPKVKKSEKYDRTFTELSDIMPLVWDCTNQDFNTAPHLLFMTTQGSGTRSIFEERFFAITKEKGGVGTTGDEEPYSPDRKQACWPQNMMRFNLDAARPFDLPKGEPWIILSGILHNENEFEQKTDGTVEQIFLKKQNGELEIRPLFLYGRLSEPKNRKLSLDPQVARFLSSLSEKMNQEFKKEVKDQSPQVELMLKIDGAFRGCFRKHTDFLHINPNNPDDAWIDHVQGSTGYIYRPNC